MFCTSKCCWMVGALSVVMASHMVVAGDLPSEFRFVEYIEQGGSGYFDTGVKIPTTASRVAFKVYAPPAQYGWGDTKWVGMYDSDASCSSFGFGTMHSNWRLNAGNKWSDIGSPTITTPAIKSGVWEVEVAGKSWTFTYEDESPVSVEMPYALTSTKASRFNIYIMGMANSAQNSTVGSRYYYLRLYETIDSVEQLTHDFRPAVRLSDEKPGFYDIKTCRFCPLVKGSATAVGSVAHPLTSACVLDIVTDSESVPGVEPYYGIGFRTAGTPVTMTAPATMPHAKGVYIHRLKGWELAVTNMVSGASSVTTGESTTKAYTPVAGDNARLTWRWETVPFDIPALRRVHRAGYTPVEYLERGDTSAYVKGGFKISKDVKRAEFAVLSAASNPGDKKWMGSFESNGYSGFGFGTMNSTWRTVNAGSWAQNVTIKKDTPCFVTVSGADWSYMYPEAAAIPVTTSKSITQASNATYEFLLFGMNNNAKDAPAGARIFCVRIYDTDGDGEKLVHYLHAVTRKSDGAVGYYDTVTETFHGLETGTATAGPEVTWKKNGLTVLVK